MLGHGIFSFTVVWIAFLVIPALELLLKPDEKNLNSAEEEMVLKDKVYDWLLYAVVPIQYACLVFFLFSVQEENLKNMDLLGRIMSMGVLCGVLGINVAHELGHRKSAFERTLSKILLLSSLYMHFYIEHNKGHHKHVSTPKDPASARRGEILFFFWFRSIICSFLSAWEIQKQTSIKNNQSFWSFSNELLHFIFIQLAFLVLIAFVFTFKLMFYFVLAALIGILLLETVNYIEHYGLSRKLSVSGAYEKVTPAHSWNSNHPLGRIFLFELSRHSDHHYKASRPYPILRHLDESPQMPTGYPGMMILAFFPPLWFKVMHKQLEKLEK